MAGNDEKEYRLFLRKIGKNIKTIREKRNLSQAAMCLEPYPFERRNWQKIESGSTNITLKTLFKISKKLDVNPVDLIELKKT